MAKKKCKCPPPGDPDWMVTYGDMMSLLLTFFILIVSFSTIKKEQQYQEVIKAIKEKFGYRGGIGEAPTENPPENSTSVPVSELPEAVREEVTTAVTEGEYYAPLGKWDSLPTSLQETEYVTYNNETYALTYIVGDAPERELTVEKVE